MSCKSRIPFISATALPLCLLLSACGGDGTTEVASIPPPSPTPAPTPTPTASPAFPAAGAFPVTTAATYDLTGITKWDGSVAPGAFELTVSSSGGGQGFDYRLSAPQGFLPGALTSIDFSPSTVEVTSSATRGSYSQTLPFSATENLVTGFAFDPGYSYVSMGEWGWRFVHTDQSSAEGGGDLLFVTGDRTPAAGIPASGTATYDAHSFELLSSNLTRGIPFTLTADFGQRTISAQIDQDYRYIATNADLLDDPAPAIHVSGTASFSNSGSFDIPLAGTASERSYNVPTPPPLDPVTGSVDGAFFGPNAEQVGGSFILRRAADEAPMYGDTFVGQQRHP